MRQFLCFRRARSALTLTVAAVVATLATVPSPARAVSINDGYTLQQLEFDYFGGASQANSTWGRFTVDPTVLAGAAGISSGYVNMHVDGVGWAVQNLYIDANDGFGAITTGFDLALPSPVRVSSASVSVDFAPAPSLNSTPGAFTANVPVGTEVWTAAGAGDANPTAIGIPDAPGSIPFLNTGLTTVLATQKNPPNVQCATNQCFPMSIANSLSFLEGQDPTGFDLPNDHEAGLKGDDSLVGTLDTLANRNAPNRTSGSGVWFVPMVQGKLTYLANNDLDEKLIIKHQGVGYGGAGNQLPAGDFTHAGATSKSAGATPTFDFIVMQLREGEDVELVWSYDDANGNPTGGHAVRIVEAGRTLGIPWLAFAHDARQTNRDANDTLGLEVRREFVFDSDGDGLLNIGSINREVRFVMSESLVPEPSAVALLGIAVAGLLFSGLRRRQASDDI